MLFCQQRGIVPRASEEVLENKGPINESSVERMTRGKETPILKEDIKECLRTIDNLFEDGFLADQDDTVVEKDVVVAEEEVTENEKEKEEEDFVEKTVTSEEQCNSLAIIVYTRPLQVASPTQTVTNDAGADP
ncbi:hypothetical protein PVK06_005351 [Gossypium arboreum]|uniref:Uncharacterized protein n=1 Tax=Gossypium arboreum TaxID=29729 RepID=A0ABR0QVC6_GOSAR|nr:hypothetical protein PVK06_005351 [Gossypium arboreum]